MVLQGASALQQCTGNGDGSFTAGLAAPVGVDARVLKNMDFNYDGTQVTAVLELAGACSCSATCTYKALSKCLCPTYS